VTETFVGVQLGSHTVFDEMRLDNLDAVGRAIEDAQKAGLIT
jgi:hypothetical protein